MDDAWRQQTTYHYKQCLDCLAERSKANHNYDLFNKCKTCKYVKGGSILVEPVKPEKPEGHDCTENFRYKYINNSGFQPGGHWKECTVCKKIFDKQEHNEVVRPKYLLDTSKEHTLWCKECEKVLGKEEHEYDDNGDCECGRHDHNKVDFNKIKIIETYRLEHVAECICGDRFLLKHQGNPCEYCGYNKK